MDSQGYKEADTNIRVDNTSANKDLIKNILTFLAKIKINPVRVGSQISCFGFCLFRLVRARNFRFINTGFAVVRSIKIPVGHSVSLQSIPTKGNKGVVNNFHLGKNNPLFLPLVRWTNLTTDFNGITPLQRARVTINANHQHPVMFCASPW